MATTTPAFQTRANRAGWILLLLMLLAMLSPLIIGAYGDIERSKHGQTGHAGQAWNVERISAYYDAGGCKPTIYICELDDIEVHWCRMDNGRAIGLIIGRKLKRIVTGYMGSVKYWENRCSQ